MKVEDGRPWERPIPHGEGEYGTFYEACAQGKLLIQVCHSCGKRQFYPRAVCVSCGQTPSWMEASGRGTVHTFTVVRQMRLAPFGDESPFVVAVVDLEEGVRMLGTVTGVEPDDVVIGLPVEAYARIYEEGRAIPYWGSTGQSSWLEG